MTCSVKIIEDSINPFTNVRLTTIQLKYWRSIHSELLTHRVFSRNASSSRALPINTVLKQVWNDPAYPIHWGSNQSGMQSSTELKGLKKLFAKFSWWLASKITCILVYLVNILVKPHKQTFNRLLEPWQYISVIVSSTEWDNFFELRNHPDAQPEIKELAHNMVLAMVKSTPVEREYHLPYVSPVEKSKYTFDVCMKLSTARCARVSYLTHDGKNPTYTKDIELYDRLVGSKPLHASPTEHSAIAMNTVNFIKNFRSWKQFRCLVEDSFNT